MHLVGFYYKNLFKPITLFRCLLKNDVQPHHIVSDGTIIGEWYFGSTSEKAEIANLIDCTVICGRKGGGGRVSETIKYPKIREFKFQLRCERDLRSSWRYHIQGSNDRTAWLSNMEPICCPETSVNKYRSTLRTISEEQRSHIPRYLTTRSSCETGICAKRVIVVVSG